MTDFEEFFKNLQGWLKSKSNEFDELNRKIQEAREEIEKTEKQRDQTKVEIDAIEKCVAILEEMIFGNQKTKSVCHER